MLFKQSVFGKMFENYTEGIKRKREKMLIIKYMRIHIFEAVPWHNFKHTVKMILLYNTID